MGFLYPVQNKRTEVRLEDAVGYHYTRSPQEVLGKEDATIKELDYQLKQVARHIGDLEKRTQSSFPYSKNNPSMPLVIEALEELHDQLVDRIEALENSPSSNATTTDQSNTMDEPVHRHSWSKLTGWS